MQKSNELVKKKTEITDKVLSRLREFQENGLKLPKDYSPENALKAAYLVLSETTDANKKPVLDSCTSVSISNSLLNMIIDGTNPMKNQCSFIAYGNQLQYDRTYFGDEMMFKRDANGKSVIPVAIHDKDDFIFEVNVETGIKRIIEHKQTLESLDTPVKGAYVYLTFNDGSKYLEIMTIDEIRKAWAQRRGNPESPAHKNFPAEMAKKTVIRRACKPYLNSLSDSNLNWDIEETKDKAKESLKNDIEEAKEKTIEFEDAEIVEDEKNPEINPTGEFVKTKEETKEEEEPF